MSDEGIRKVRDYFRERTGANKGQPSAKNPGLFHTVGSALARWGNLQPIIDAEGMKSLYQSMWDNGWMRDKAMIPQTFRAQMEDSFGSPKSDYRSFTPYRVNDAEFQKFVDWWEQNKAGFVRQKAK